MKNFADLCQYLINANAFIMHVLTITTKLTQNAAHYASVGMTFVITAIAMPLMIFIAYLLCAVMGAQINDQVYDKTNIRTYTDTKQFGLPYIVCFIGLMCVLASVSYAMLMSPNAYGYTFSQTSDIGWILSGIGFLLMCTCACSVAPIAFARALSKKQYRKAVSFAVLTIIVSAICVEPIITSCIEFAVNTDCHKQFVTVLTQDEANKTKYTGKSICTSSNDCTTVIPQSRSWAMNVLMFTNVMAFLAPVFVGITTGRNSVQMNRKSDKIHGTTGPLRTISFK